MKQYIFGKDDSPLLEIAISAETESEAKERLNEKLKKADEWLLIYGSDDWKILHVHEAS